MPTQHSFTLILLCLLTYTVALAQTDYAVTLKGDTLRGELKVVVSSGNLDRLQINLSGKKVNYTALQIKSYFHSGAVYQSMKYENAYRFMKVLKAGYLGLFAFRPENQSSWDGRYLAKIDGSGMEVPNLGFKKALSKYLSDCHDVSNRLENGDLGKRDLERIIDLYNTCIQTKTIALGGKLTPLIANEKEVAVKNFVAKVEAESFLAKKDALDLLKDIQAKVSKNETVPNYLIEGLKSYLNDTPTLAKDLEGVIALLKK